MKAIWNWCGDNGETLFYATNCLQFDLKYMNYEIITFYHQRLSPLHFITSACLPGEELDNVHWPPGPIPHYIFFACHCLTYIGKKSQKKHTERELHRAKYLERNKFITIRDKLKLWWKHNFHSPVKFKMVGKFLTRPYNVHSWLEIFDMPCKSLLCWWYVLEI